MPTVLLVILLLLAALVAVLLIRAALFGPQEQSTAAQPFEVVDREGAAARFSAVIQKPTVSNRDPALVDPQPFEELIALLPELYPAVHHKLTREIVAGYSLLYHWQGTHLGKPTVLMAHYDVVPAQPEGWRQPPFSGLVKDGVIWGRGTLDTKVTVVSALEAVERLLHEGFTPEHDIYLSFGHDEEIGGVTGTPSIVKLLQQRGIEPAMVLDEGGAVINGLFPGVSRPIAVIGTAEKGRTDVRLTVASSGGHASTPPKDDPAVRLARAITRLNKKPFPAHFSPTTVEMLGTLGRHTAFGPRIIFANLWLFKPLLLRIFVGMGGQIGAMCRTTFAVTMLQGSESANILPTSVSAVANMRSAVGETVAGDIEFIRRVIGDDRVQIDRPFEAEPSPVSSTNCEAYQKLRQCVNETYPEAVVTPYIMVAQSDSRHYGAICRNVYRFTPLSLSKEELGSMHNINECIPVEKYCKCIEFYLRFIRRL